MAKQLTKAEMAEVIEQLRAERDQMRIQLQDAEARSKAVRRKYELCHLALQASEARAAAAEARVAKPVRPQPAERIVHLRGVPHRKVPDGWRSFRYIPV